MARISRGDNLIGTFRGSPVKKIEKPQKMINNFEQRLLIYRRHNIHETSSAIRHFAQSFDVMFGLGQIS